MSFNKFIDRQRSRLSRDKTRHKGHKLHGEHLHGFFSEVEDLKDNPKDDVQKARHQQQLKDVKAALTKRNISGFSDDDVGFALRLPFTGGSIEKAIALLRLISDSENLVVRDYDSKIKLQGAINCSAVSCYLDSVLFAMFAQLKSFESMLLERFEDRNRNHLAALLRLWVNLERSGYLVTNDITREIQEALGRCGWKDATEIHQQDAMEAFTFILEQLGFPDLHLKMDIFHSGKEDKDDDHKIIRERVLVMPLPEPHEDGTPIKLEDCFELALIARIDVRRKYEQERRATFSSMRSPQAIDFHKAAAVHVEAVEVEVSPVDPEAPASEALPSYSSIARPEANRTSSFITERAFPADEKQIEAGEDPSLQPSTSRGRAASLRKEVLMPAWQMYSLIPFHTEEEPKSDAEVVAHLREKQPTFCIALKRYSYSKDGHAARRSDYVDIPLDMALPHFIQDSNSKDSNHLFERFKISLQSLVCHRGSHVESGHYISLTRMPDADGGTKWMIHDDLVEPRVREINIQKALKEETPYLLFYRVEPIGDHAPTATLQPPPYELLGGVAEVAPSVSSESEPPGRQSTEVMQVPISVPVGRTSTSRERPSSVTFSDSSLLSAGDAEQSGAPSNNSSSALAQAPTVAQTSGLNPAAAVNTVTSAVPEPPSTLRSAPVSRHGSRLHRKGAKPRSRGTSADPKGGDSPRPSRNRLSGLFTSSSANSNAQSAVLARRESSVSNAAAVEERGRTGQAGAAPVPAPAQITTEPPTQAPEAPAPVSVPAPSEAEPPRLIRKDKDREKEKEKEKEKARYRLSAHGTLSKARKREERPERECDVM